MPHDAEMWSKMTWSTSSVFMPSGPDGRRLVLVAEPEAQVADDDVRRLLDLERLVLQADAVAGRGLAGDREERLVDLSGVLSSIVPETSKTIVRGPLGGAMPSRSEPGPDRRGS